MTTHVQFFKALADETRQEILRVLGETEELCVNDLCERFSKLSQPTISHHLQILRNSDLVRTRREGKLIYYQIRRGQIEDLSGSFFSWFRIEVRME